MVLGFPLCKGLTENLSGEAATVNRFFGQHGCREPSALQYSGGEEADLLTRSAVITSRLSRQYEREHSGIPHILSTRSKRSSISFTKPDPLPVPTWTAKLVPCCCAAYTCSRKYVSSLLTSPSASCRDAVQRARAN